MSDDEFDFDVRMGLLFTVEGASLSIASVVFILSLAFRRWVKRKANEIPRPSDASDSSLFLNLMVADLIQAIGVMPSIKWMNDARISEGSLCTAQAVLKQVGIVGVALTSLMIAIHTFAVLVGRWAEPKHGQKYMILAVWVCTALIIGIPNAIHRKEKYYGPAQYWCWIPRSFPTEQIVTEYLWVWVAATSMAALYGIMFVVLKRSAKELKDLAKVTKARESDDDLTRTRRTKAIAYSLLFYPAVYIAYIFPNSLARWMYFQQTTQVPVHFTFFANTIFALGGVFNLMLFLFTRREVVVGPQPASTPSSPNYKQHFSSPPPPRKARRVASYEEAHPHHQHLLPATTAHRLGTPSSLTPDIEKLSHISDDHVQPWRDGLTVPGNGVDHIATTTTSPTPIYETPRAFAHGQGGQPGKIQARPRSQYSTSSRGDDDSDDALHLPSRT